MAKKTATKEPAKTKAAITPEQLAVFLGLEKGSSKGLKPYCDASQSICNSFAGTELSESQGATIALLHCAAWLQMTKAKTIKEIKEIPLKVRYMVIYAAESAKA